MISGVLFNVFSDQLFNFFIKVVRCFIAERRTYNVGRLAYLMLRLCDGKFLFIQKINPFHLMLNQSLNNGLSIIQS